MDVTTFSGSVTMFIKAMIDSVIDKEGVCLVTNLVGKEASDVVTVSTSGFLVIAFRHLVWKLFVNNRFFKSAVFVELAIAEIDVETVLLLVPVVRNRSVETGGLPRGLGGEADLRDGSPFRVGGNLHVEVCETVIDFHGSDVTLRCDESGRLTRRREEISR